MGGGGKSSKVESMEQNLRFSDVFHAKDSSTLKILVVALCFSGVLEIDNKLIIADICIFKRWAKLL